MSQAEKQALALRDLAVIVAKAKGVITAPDLYSYQDARLRIEHCSGKPHALTVWISSETEMKVLSVIWQDGGDAVVVLHRSGSWEDSLKRLAKG